ncbi:hypothetical protein DL98DRAFT_596974 [Cadophora sp. DSE1049]|nr:hypothetical protein DL98DRAFT_596974 [Cadophora sp. DSE1049]
MHFRSPNFASPRHHCPSRPPLTNNSLLPRLQHKSNLADGTTCKTSSSYLTLFKRLKAFPNRPPSTYTTATPAPPSTPPSPPPSPPTPRSSSASTPTSQTFPLKKAPCFKLSTRTTGPGYQE